jgi:phosphoglycerate dehydrogenase-like enzyme
MGKILLTQANFTNDDFSSEARREGIAELAEMADIDYYDEELTDKNCDGVVAVIANSHQIHGSFYEAGDDLRIIARWGVGYEKTNLEMATEQGVMVTVAPEHMVTVAEYAIAQWMATLKRVYTLNTKAHAGDIQLLPTFEAAGSTLGLYGMGRIGQAVAERAVPLLGETGRLLVYDIRPDIAEVAARFGAEAVDDPMRLFEECDTVSLHTAGAETIVTYREMSAMKPHASLINPSRGTLVDDEAANRAVTENRFFYYVVDDPVNGPRAIHKGHPRIICTNHNAGVSVESIRRLDLQTFGQVRDALEGRAPAHLLNAEVLDHPRQQAAPA